MGVGSYCSKVVILLVKVSRSAYRSTRLGVGVVGVLGCYVDSILSKIQRINCQKWYFLDTCVCVCVGSTGQIERYKWYRVAEEVLGLPVTKCDLE